MLKFLNHEKNICFDKGASASSSPAELAAQTSYIITMLPSHPHVNEVFTSKTGILS